MQKSDHHIGDLHAGVVNIVLHVYLASGKLQQADKCVAENRIAKMSNVSCFVWIDTGVLDENFAGTSFRHGRLTFDHRCSDYGTIHAGIDVPSSGNFKVFKALDRTNT